MLHSVSDDCTGPYWPDASAASAAASAGRGVDVAAGVCRADCEGAGSADEDCGARANAPDASEGAPASACRIGGSAPISGVKTGGSSSTVYSRSSRPRGHVASTSNVTNGFVIGCREVTLTTYRPAAFRSTLKLKPVSSDVSSSSYRSNAARLASPTLKPSR